MTAKKVDQDPGPIKNDGKVSQIHAGSNAKSKKNAVKYTLWRSKEDVAKIEKLKNFLNDKSARSFNTDSQIYKELPDLYLNAVKKNVQLQRQVDELTAKLATLEDLRTSFCRIFEICEMKK
ncbi:MAG: hypothetical protein KAR64_01570 [Thermoplasmatales archaeon]|nr:hypothetical protein [Thermoplasmatales archaeon]